MSSQPTPPRPAVVAFASDYGHLDPFVGLCHLAVRRTAAELGGAVDVVDVCHALPAFDAAAGATLLADALPWLAPARVVLAVVDPGVGTERAGVVVRAGDGAAAVHLVGPDNGLLTGAVGDRARAAWQIVDPPRPSPVDGEPVAATFDGRDVFAPLAAALAVDPATATAGLEPVAVDELVAPARLSGEATAGRVRAQVVRVDGFGNLALSVGASAIAAAGWVPGQPVTVRVGEVGERAHPATVARTFADAGPGGLAVLGDAFGRLQLAVDRGRASDALAAGPGHTVTVVSAGP